MFYLRWYWRRDGNPLSQLRCQLSLAGRAKGYAIYTSKKLLIVVSTPFSALHRARNSPFWLYTR